MSWAPSGNIKGPKGDPGDVSGAPVTSVFGRLGDVIAAIGDYAAYYEKVLGDPAADGYLLSSTALGVRSWIPAPSSLPSGGNTSDVLAKASPADYDAHWIVTHGLPAGGAVGDVISKVSTTDYDAHWSAPTGSEAINTGPPIPEFMFDISGEVLYP